MKINKINKFLLFLVSLLLSVTAGAQIRISSPYSYYGLGDMFHAGTPVNASMGGINAGLRTKGLINFNNPASYSSIDTNSFIFDIGVNSDFNQLRSKSATQNYTNYTALSHILFNFSATRWMGLSLGLVPYARTGYKMITSDTLPNIGKVDESFDGSGGYNQAFIGAGFRIKNFSLGVNMGYLFGTTDKAVTVYTPDLTFSYNIRKLGFQSISGINLNYGLQYEANLKNNYFLTAGTRFNLPTKISSTRSELVQRFTASGEVESIKDTTYQTEDEKGKIKLPFMIGGGLTFGKRNYWMVGVDFDWQNWKKFTNFGETDSLNNSYRISVGGEIMPKAKANSSYWKKMIYRFGFHYGNTNLKVHNAVINNWGVSAGFGFPISRFKTYINLSAEIGQLGNTNDNLIQENYIRFAIGFNFKEFWFYKPKLR